MQRNEDIKQRLQGYPSYISKEQLCKICHISKRTALRLLEDGSIPCKSNGKQTRKFQIALADVEAFLLKRQARIKINPREARNVYRPMSAEMKSLLPHVVTDWLEPYPDVLSVDEVVQITGYGSSSVVKWCKKEDLQHYCIGRKFFVPKTAGVYAQRAVLGDTRQVTYPPTIACVSGESSQKSPVIKNTKKREDGYHDTRHRQPERRSG